MAIARASAQFFTLDEMVGILDLDADAVSDSGIKDKLDKLSYAASDFLMARTGYDWSADDVKDPLAVDCASMFVKKRYYEGTAYESEYDLSLGINADLNDLCIKVSNNG